MSAVYPGAKWRPIGVNFTDRKRSRTDFIAIHSSASEASSLYGWFTNPRAGASSHLHLPYDGLKGLEQYIDLDKISWATGEGNGRSVSIEVAGVPSSKPNEPFTDAQVDGLVEIVAFLARRYSIPLVAMKSSAAGERGVGWHRLGVDGNFPSLPSPLAGRRQRGGGERWSSARGKVCPGDARIEQIVGKGGIIERAQALLDDDLNGKPDDEGKPTSKPGTGKPSRIVVDGYWGPATTRRLQAVLGTPVDGVLSGQVQGPWNRNLRSASWASPSKARGSLAIRALQRRVGVKADGLLGPVTIRAMQRRYGTPQDGVISAPSPMVRALQRRLNDGKV